MHLSAAEKYTWDDLCSATPASARAWSAGAGTASGTGAAGRGADGFAEEGTHKAVVTSGSWLSPDHRPPPNKYTTQSPPIRHIRA
jgi:hypothetical protein